MRLIDADRLYEVIKNSWDTSDAEDFEKSVFIALATAPTIEPEQHTGRWIPCSERLPMICQTVLLSTNTEKVHIGHRVKPDLVWQVEENGRKHWVYDPEEYTDNIDSLPKAEDISFVSEKADSDGWLSVTSINYNIRFAGVIAWMPLPEPTKKEEQK